MTRLTFGSNPYDQCATQRGRYHVIDSAGMIRWKSDYGIYAYDYAGVLSDREPGKFSVIDTRDGSTYGAYQGGKDVPSV